MKPIEKKGKDSDSTKLDVTVSENKTVTVSRSNSPTTMSSSAVSSPVVVKSSTTSHRSRKEKLVVRSFSTETNASDDMEPHILTREEYLREKRAQAMGSNPSTPRSSRESSPVEDEGDNRNGERGGGSPSPRKNTEEIDVENIIDSLPPPPSYSEHSEREVQLPTITKITSPLKLKFKTKLNKKKKHDSSEGKEKRVKHKYLGKKSAMPSMSRRSPVFITKQPPATFVKNSSLPSSPEKSLLKPIIIPSTSATAAAGLPKRRPVPNLRRLLTPPLPTQRKFVKYNILQDRLPKQWFKDSTLANVTKVKSPSFTIPPPRRPSSHTRKPLPSLLPKTSLNKKFGPAVDSTNDKNEIRIHCMSNEEHEAIANSARLDALTLSQGMERLQDLVKNTSPKQLKREGVALPQICADAVAKLVTVATEFPFPVSGTNAPLVDPKDLSESETLNDEDQFEQSVVESENEENFESPHPFVHHAKKLIRNQGITKELKVLMESNQDQAAATEFQPLFPVGASFMKNSTPTLPRIRAEELEILKELLTPDEHFELAEDEMEIVKLYIELMRSELKVFREDQKKAKRMSSILVNTKAGQEGSNSSATGRKIVDAYAIPVKFSSEEERSRIKSALPGLILTQEEVVQNILIGNTSQSKDSLKELKTRRLRNGKEVPLEKIRLENTKVKSKTSDSKDISRSSKVAPINKPSKTTTNKKSIANTSFTVPPTQIDPKNNAFITMEPFMTLRDGKELPYDQKDFDIFRGDDEPFFKVEVKPEYFEKEMKPLGLDGGAGIGISCDEYSQKVEANMKRLQDGGREYEYEYERASKMIHSGEFGDGSSNRFSLLEKERLLLATATTTGTASSSSSLLSIAPLPSTAIAGSETLPRRATDQLPSPNPQYRRKLFSCSSSETPSGSSSTAIPISSIRRPETPPPSSFISSNGNGFGGGGILSSPQQRQLRARYSRQQHSSLCPPFENNHCSFTAHYCPFPRAPGSRFCISHVDEGATLQFERCKYFKDSRECGRFIPKADLNSLHVFCELHATIVANARLKKCKSERQQEQEKFKPKKSILLTQLNNNLDRTKGAIMERNEDGVFSVRKELVQDENETLNDSSGSDSDEEADNVHKLEGETMGDEDTDVDDADVDVEGIFPGTDFLTGSSSPPPGEYDYDCLRNAGHVTVDETVKIYQQKLRQKKQLIGRFMEIEKIKFRHEWRQYCRETGWLKRQRVNFTTDPKCISTSTLRSVHCNMSDEKIQQCIGQEVKVHRETQAVLNHRVNRGPRTLLRHQILRKRHDIFSQSEIKRAKFECKEEAKICSRPRAAPLVLCAFGSGGAGGQMKCNTASLPLSRFCPVHINEDKNQKLFRPCHFKYGPDGDDVCSTPVLTHLEEFGCPLHALPMLPKEPPPKLKENRGPKVEENIEKILQEVSDEEKAAREEEGEIVQDLEYNDEEIEQEMEDLVGDEMVDMDHLREVVRTIYGKGLYVTDSEESDDTDEDEDPEEQPQQTAVA